MSKQIHSSCSAEDPGWQHSGDNTKDQLRPVSQTISVAGAVCMDQEPTLHSSAIAFAGEMPERGGGTVPQVLHYTTSSVNRIYWFIWHNVNLWSCLFSVRVSKRGSKQTDGDSAWQSSNPKVSKFSTKVPRWEKKKGRNKHIVKFFFCYLGPAVTHSTTHQKGRMKLAMHCQISLLKQTNWLLAHKKKGMWHYKTQLHIHKTP